MKNATAMTGDEIERLAREIFPELAGARLVVVGKRCSDVREEIAGFKCSNVSPDQRRRILAAVEALETGRGRP